MHSTGVIVSATSSDAPMLVTYARPSGRSSRPSSPLKKNSGANTSRMMAVAYTTELRISRDAS